MKTIQLKAADTLFFRDAKPFSMGEETWANSLFPNVPPSVILGALRTAYASEKNLDKSEIFDRTKRAKIKNFGLILREQVCFPIPLDLYGYAGKTQGLMPKETHIASSPFSKILYSEANEKVQELDNYRMSLADFNRYLEGEKKFIYDADDKRKNEFLNLIEYTTAEPKVGIGRNKQTNTTREGMLYRVGMTRFEGKERGNIATIFVSFNGLELPDNGILRLGAENKVVTYKVLSKNIEANTNMKWEKVDCFKIYLFTPAILNKGIIPGWINEKMEGEIAGIRVKLQTCNVGRFLAFGGFDIKDQIPKQMYKAVPSGSVYFFELINKNDTEKQLQTIVNHFKNNSFSEQNAVEGLGVVYIAKQ